MSFVCFHCHVPTVFRAGADVSGSFSGHQGCCNCWVNCSEVKASASPPMRWIYCCKSNSSSTAPWRFSWGLPIFHLPFFSWYLIFALGGGETPLGGVSSALSFSGKSISGSMTPTSSSPHRFAVASTTTVHGRPVGRPNGRLVSRLDRTDRTMPSTRPRRVWDALCLACSAAGDVPTLRSVATK